MKDAAIAAAVLLLNGPQYIRNYQLSRSILGFDSAWQPFGGGWSFPCS